jgi:hypothetical protein
MLIFLARDWDSARLATAFSSARKTARPQDHPASLIILHADDLVPIILHPIGPDDWYDSAADPLTIETYIAESGWS